MTADSTSKPEQLVELLHAWNGGRAYVVSYASGHRTLHVDVYSTAHPGSHLRLVCTDTMWFSGPLSWEDCSLQVLHGVGIYGGESGCIVFDARARLTIETTILGVEEIREKP